MAAGDPSTGLNTTNSQRSSASMYRDLFRVLASMNFAIMLLVIIAVASVIGTILQQNQPYQDYIIKFGPYWHEVYQALGLYDVYSSGWFVTILAFLVVTTSICIYRNGPQMLRSLQRFSEGIHEQSLLKMRENRQWSTGRSVAELKPRIEHYLQQQGYRTRSREGGNCITIAAMKGGANRIGYILTHVSIVVICVGGLLDGNLPLKLKQLSGQVSIETRDLSVSDIPAKSRLSADNPSFRASVSIPEGARIDYAFINIAGGYLLQKLPFSIKVNDFRIEHYSNGQPKSFTSDLVIHDPDKKESFDTTISVNHPLIYRGYAIYQSSFADGGTRLQLQLRNLLGEARTTPLQGAINRHAEVTSGNSTMRIEFDDFRPFNIFAKEEGSRDFVDYGPNFTYKLRREDGSAHEYVNYMHPVLLDGRYYYLSGVRDTPVDEFQYLYIPVDADHSMERFFRFQSLLYDEEKTEEIINQSITASLQSMPDTDVEFEQNVKNAMLKVLALFREGGIEAISQYSGERLDGENDEAGLQAYMQFLQSGLRQIYLAALEEEGISNRSLDENHSVFFDDAVTAMNAMHYYGSPFYLQLEEYDHRQATGLQITRTPGKKFVYLGFSMLIAGIFFLFYIHYQRLWVRLNPGSGNTRIIMAGSRARHRRDFARVFSQQAGELKSLTTAEPNHVNDRHNYET